MADEKLKELNRRGRQMIRAAVVLSVAHTPAEAYDAERAIEDLAEIVGDIIDQYDAEEVGFVNKHRQRTDVGVVVTAGEVLLRTRIDPKLHCQTCKDRPLVGLSGACPVDEELAQAQEVNRASDTEND